MIEAGIEWTLEGPNDSITFNDGGPWILQEKPRTSVDDRRETYDYPLDDGGFVGDAYAGMRAWSLKGMLKASSHSERNTELQRLNALLNSLRRADGLLKWQPNGFPAVQATVRRMGSVDYSGGANLHVPITFGLLSGDPRVYSQTEQSETTVAGAPTYGTNLLSANTSSMETDASGWVAGSGDVISRSTTYASAGSASLRISRASTNYAFLSAESTERVAVTPGASIFLSARGRASSGRSANLYVNAKFYDASSNYMEDAGPGVVASVTDASFATVSRTVTVPSGAASLSVVVSFGDNVVFTPGEYQYIDDVNVNLGSYAAAVDVVAAGDTLTYPVYVVTGPAGTPVIGNLTRQEEMTLNTSVDAPHALTIDSAAREIFEGSVATGNRYESKASAEPFPLVEPGTNAFTFAASGADANTELEIRWRDAWMP